MIFKRLEYLLKFRTRPTTRLHSDKQRILAKTGNSLAALSPLSEMRAIEESSSFAAKSLLKPIPFTKPSSMAEISRLTRPFLIKQTQTQTNLSLDGTSLFPGKDSLPVD